MSVKAILIHLRLPFSLFLMPVFWFGLSLNPDFSLTKAALVFFIIHFLLYPASNAYNSYFDKDEGSIGGIENPPPVHIELYYTALVLDVFAIALSYFFIGFGFAFAVFVYGLFSRAYSNTKIRIKKYPFLSWLIVGFFQGFWVLCAVYQALNRDFEHFTPKIYLAGILSSVLLWALYPMTQIYQHEEDASRGDETLSRKLGILGTFYFTGIVFFLGLIGFYFYLSTNDFIAFNLFTFPITVYFAYWFFTTFKDRRQANFKNTMILNALASFCMNAFYMYLVFRH
jgi:4-hydroxybenzoate polyprenyltransferase